MTQYSTERKESVVRRMLASQELSIRELSQDTGICQPHTVRRYFQGKHVQYAAA